MEDATNTLNSGEMQKLRRALEVLGFSQESIDSQLERLGNTVLLAVINRVAEEKGDVQVEAESPEQIQQFLNEHYSQEEIAALLREEGEKKIQGFLDAVTANVDRAKVSEIESILAS